MRPPLKGQSVRFDALEAAKLYVRTERYQRTKFEEMMTKANGLALRHGLYFDASDRVLIDRYLHAMQDVGVLLASKRADKVFQALRYAMETTAADISLEGLGPEIQGRIQDLEDSRGAVVASFQQHVGRPFA